MNLVIHFSTKDPVQNHIWRYAHEPLARYVQLRVAHAPGMPGTCSPPPQVGDPGRHHGTGVMHAGIANLWFPLRSAVGKTFPVFPAHAQPAILRIWWEAHTSICNDWYAFCHNFPINERKINASSLWNLTDFSARVLPPYAILVVLH